MLTKGIEKGCVTGVLKSWVKVLFWGQATMGIETRRSVKT